MGTRIRIGKGFTYGRSGVRWGHSLPWKDGYGSVGASGTLVTGGPLRHWEPAGRTPSGATRCQGLTREGNQCASSATLGATCRRHESQAGQVMTTSVGPRLRDQWGVGSIMVVIFMVALIWGFFAFLEKAESDYCANNPNIPAAYTSCPF